MGDLFVILVTFRLRRRRHRRQVQMFPQSATSRILSPKQNEKVGGNQLCTRRVILLIMSRNLSETGEENALEQWINEFLPQ